MKIGSLLPTGVNPYKTTKVQSKATEKPSMGSDRLEISESSRLFSEALKVAQSTVDVRADRVDAIREQISNGQYRVDSRQIAEKMLGGVIGNG